MSRLLNLQPHFDAIFCVAESQAARGIRLLGPSVHSDGDGGVGVPRRPVNPWLAIEPIHVGDQCVDRVPDVAALRGPSLLTQDELAGFRVAVLGGDADGLRAVGCAIVARLTGRR